MTTILPKFAKRTETATNGMTWKVVKLFFAFLLLTQFIAMMIKDEFYESSLLLTGRTEEDRVLSTSSGDQMLYPLDNDDLQKYLVDVKTSTRRVGNLDKWIKTADKFYDCAPEIKAKYTPAPAPKQSTNYKGQEGEDKYLYQQFFHSVPSRPHKFVELGALDGVQFANSYFFEKDLGWGGVLIEGETSNYGKLEKNRGQGSQNENSVTTAHMAICEEPRFIKMSGSGPMAAQGVVEGTRITTVPCVPMREVLAMAKLSHVDLYSIDVEGAELAVIRTHDFHAVPAHVVLIEMRPADEGRDFSNAKIRRALYARDFCRFDNSVGHNNEVWINATWVEPDNLSAALEDEHISKS